MGHAKVILGLAAEHQQQLAAERVIKEGLNVRQTEGLIAKWQSRPVAPAKPHPAADAQIAAIEGRVREKLGSKVHLRYNRGKGALEISFFSDEELERLLHILGINTD